MSRHCVEIALSVVSSVIFPLELKGTPKKVWEQT